MKEPSYLHTIIHNRLVLAAAMLLACAALAGCGRTERTITVTSDPDGALVYANGVEVGRPRRSSTSTA